MSENKDYNIIFGSGELFVVPEGADADNEDELLLIGESNGEAGLVIEPEFHSVRGGRGHHVLASFKTEEEITFNAGIVTLDLERMSDILASHYEEEDGKRILKLGGDYTIPINRLRFVHYKKQDGNRLIIDMYRAMNQAGLELNFNAEEESVFELEFTLLKAKNKDNIVTIIEEFDEDTEQDPELY